MTIGHGYLSTGISELDGLLKGLIPGDNIVWNVESVDVYRLFAEPFCRRALAHGETVTYFRFARHEPLLTETAQVNLVKLHPDEGFEQFINDIHAVIETNGVGGFYLFDCLTELVDSWYSDEMLGNFFKLTCPYLLDIEALAYFALIKQRHSQNALQPILNTTQLFMDVFRRAGDVFIHPIKVQQRYSTTMHMLHHWRDHRMVPVAQSGLTSEIYHTLPWVGESSASKVFDLWNQTFVEAEYLLADPRGVDAARAGLLFENLVRMVVTRDERLLPLVRSFLSLHDLVRVGQRMVGTGLIGGKSVGMLLAQAILRKSDPRWHELLEMHDSFYIGSDVFYTYLVRNGCWWARQQKDLDASLYNAKHARRLILTGQFPDQMIEKFSEMLDYFGQAPIIVRSSSLLEDNYGNAFSGKYESVFCPNQGSRKKCLEDLLTAVRTIYASAMSEKAIRYRAQCNMLDQDEQMALLVQRVSGGLSGSYFYPLLAGVGYSYNPYVWSEYIEAEAGVLRLVFGLGTRAVDRSDDDYTCLAALNDPHRRPDESSGDHRRCSQRKVDVIDLEANRVVSVPYEGVLARADALQMTTVAADDPELERQASETGRRIFTKVITFDNLFRETDFIPRMREGLAHLQAAYGCPVDVEFTANFINEQTYRINVVQCRPFQVKDSTFNRELTQEIESKPIVLRSNGPVIGHGREARLDRIVYVEPSTYGELAANERYAVARLIGRVMESPEMCDSTTMFVGPGRWGTTTPALGVPVVFAEISRATVLCEVVMMRSELVPDVSLGTHFFNDLVERDILYMAVYPERDGVVLDWGLLRQAPLVEIPELADSLHANSHVLRVIDATRVAGDKSMKLYANSTKQQVVCYLD
jgi:pyruvate,water dikinase